MTPEFGRFTARGGAQIEETMRLILDDVREALSSALPASKYRTVVLMGGYGRGEGGVDRSDRADQPEKPHNNLDIMIVSHRQADGASLKEKADGALEAVVAKHAIGIDVGTIGVDALAKSSCLVMWYDMRFGHKPILGDADYLPSLEQFTVERIAPADVRNLLVNRGTLLVINDLILEKATLTESDRRTVIKHGIKAIIGYGDALLFFKGAYHWSYIEKQKRMRARADMPTLLKALYDEAAEFRFEPDYDRFLKRDLTAWNSELRRAFEPVHLQCEEERIGKKLRWGTYLDDAFAHVLIEDALRPRAYAKKLLAAARSGRVPKGLRLAASLGYRATRMRDKFPILFPFVIYDLDASRSQSIVASALGAANSKRESLRRAYLRAWGKEGDVNFGNVLRKLGLSLDGSEANG